jgi:hypothetical protein
MSKQHIVTSTSLSVSFESQSRFSVSTHTPPVCGSTFGWKIGVLKFAVGGFCGYEGGIVRCSFQTPAEKGVLRGPARRMSRSVRESESEAEGGKR